SLPENYALVYSDQRGRRDRKGHCYVYDEGGERVAYPREECEALAALLDATSCISVPIHFRNESLGRVFITSKRRQHFKQADIDFLLQATRHFMPQIDNIRLVDKLASDAAEQERKRIARDIHDSVIQPYIGLQIGLSAINQKLAQGGQKVNQDVESLIEMTGTAIDSLRGYVSGLKENGEHEDSLMSSLRRFAAKYTEVTGINVIVDAQTYSRINDRLAAEAFQMATEGLSNIRRHTRATLARIVLSCDADKFTLRIENDSPEKEPPVAFMPYSIKDRAASLGGRTRVEQSVESGTAIIVEIPL
ncbi:MAG TPA: histidine kinase, partial [Blastocatellia bacterium]|nr:histidine kinase [Blastocatellia bacterium]